MEPEINIFSKMHTQYNVCSERIGISMHELTEDEAEQKVSDLLTQETPAGCERLVCISIEEEKDIATCCIKEA